MGPLKGTGVTSSLTATTLTRGTNGTMRVVTSTFGDLGTNENFISTAAVSSAASAWGRRRRHYRRNHTPAR